MNAAAVRVARLAFAGLALAAVGASAWRAILNGSDLVELASYFTVQTTLIAATVLILTALRPGGQRPHWLDWWRAASAVYVTVTFVVVIVLLQRHFGWVDWIDFVTHKLFPVVIVADFLLDPPRNRLSVRDALWMVSYGIAYLAYTFVRGAATGWYPYPFLDPAVAGPAMAAVTTAAIVGAGMALSVLYLWLARRRWQPTLISRRNSWSTARKSPTDS